MLLTSAASAATPDERHTKTVSSQRTMAPTPVTPTPSPAPDFGQAYIEFGIRLRRAVLW